MPTTEICPRCNEPISWITKKERNGKYYYYAVHYYGRGKRKECYLGPVDGYTYAEKINPIGLTNANEKERFLNYLHRIIDNYLVKDKFSIDRGLDILDEIIDLLIAKASEEDKEKIVERLKAWIEKLEEERKEK